MQNNFNILTKELSLLKKTLNLAPSMSNISSKDFLLYQSLISKKENIESQLFKLNSIKNKISTQYSQKNEKWLYDDNMSCIKYCKLEKKAAYIRDKKLYKLGFINSKPIHPIIENIKNFVNNKVINPINSKTNFIINKLNSSISKSPIYKKFEKIKTYTHQTIPDNLTKLAIYGTKKCILGYRHANKYIQNFSRSLYSVPTIQMLAYIKNAAKKEADLQSDSFKDRIRVIPNNYITNNSINTNSTPHKYYSINHYSR